jgi:hypothetical protein
MLPGNVKAAGGGGGVLEGVGVGWGLEQQLQLLTQNQLPCSVNVLHL